VRAALSSAFGVSGLEPGAVARRQDRLLRALVRHAYRNVPRYRTLFDEKGIDPAQIHGVGDLELVPVTSRRELQTARPEDLVASRFEPGELGAFRTSGSSGSPLTIRRTYLERKILQLFRIRALRDFGVGIRDRIARVGLPPRSPSRAELLNRFGLGLYRSREIDARLSPRRVIERLREVDPDVLTGYPSTISRLAAALTAEDRAAIRPRLAILGGEVVSGRTRRLVEEAFGTTVREWYGSFECNLIASECPETGRLHVADDSVILEVRTPDGRRARPGERGEVVVTSLHSYAMPFLRYRLGDAVTAGGRPCPCGRPFSTIGEIQGRMLDYFHLGDGRLVHPYEVTNDHIKPESWILQYQLVQEAGDDFRLRVVPGSSPSEETLERLRTAVAGALGGETRVSIDLVPEISPGPGGKCRQAVPLSSRPDSSDRG